jgi:hypothetical protein
MTCSDRTVILKWTGPPVPPRVPHAVSGAGGRFLRSAVRRVRAMLWLFCRRCAGIFKSPVIVALCPYCQSERTLDGSTGTALTGAFGYSSARVSALVGLLVGRAGLEPAT